MIEPFSYVDGPPPPSYACASCKTVGVKLWRQYQTFADNVRLLCGACACADQDRPGPVGDDGRVVDQRHGFRSDQIGWLVPAVPTEDGETFWGYTSVPRDGVDWWKRLPTRPSPLVARIAELERDRAELLAFIQAIGADTPADSADCAMLLEVGTGEERCIVERGLKARALVARLAASPDGKTEADRG